MSGNENEKVSVDQYGRKTWDVEAYAKEAKRSSHDKDQPHNSTRVSQLTSITSGKPTSYLNHRSQLLEQSIKSVNKHTLINPLNTKSYGKDKRFGFFCPICDLSFRDNLALIDHVNSPQHVSRSQELTQKLKASKQDSSSEQKVLDEDEELLDGGIRRASLEEVVATIERLVAESIRHKQSPDSAVSINDRIAKRRAFEQKRLESRRRKRADRKAKRSTMAPSTHEAQDNIAALMGFQGFGTTKK